MTTWKCGMMSAILFSVQSEACLAENTPSASVVGIFCAVLLLALAVFALVSSFGDDK